MSKSGWTVARLPVEVTVERAAPPPGKNAMYMTFGTHVVVTDTHRFCVYTSPLGHRGPVITARRLDEPVLAERHYTFAFDDLLEAVCRLEGSAGRVRKSETEGP